MRRQNSSSLMQANLPGLLGVELGGAAELLAVRAVS